MIDFDISFQPSGLILLASETAAAFTGIWSRFFPIWKAGSAVRPEGSEPPAGECPKVSVIVHTFTEEEETIAWLEMAMAQDYPDFEVILVNEGSSETTAALAERVEERWPEGLYVTFVPHEAYNLSRRKLAVTVGMKAARGEIVVTTFSNCTIPSTRWLSDLVAPIVAGNDVALGYSHVDFNDLRGAGKWYREMDSTLTASQWIGAAAAGHPYRGNRANLAFRKELFFINKGYSKTIHLMNGEDDLFLLDFMDGDNTGVSISADSILTEEWGLSGNRMLADYKERYDFTSRFLPTWPFKRAGLGSLMQWAVAGCFIATTIEGLPSLFPGSVALGIMLLYWLAEILIYRRTARRLGSVALWWSLPWFLLWHPVGNFLSRLRYRRHIRKNYTFG